jgi:transposase
MPWSERKIMDLREEFAYLASKEECSMSLLCRRYGISRKTGYKWLTRYNEKGSSGLEDRPRKPKLSPQKISQAMVDKVIEIRDRHPRWGGLKIKAVLERQGVSNVPVASCIQNILKRHGRIRKRSVNPTLFRHSELRYSAHTL